MEINLLHEWQPQTRVFGFNSNHMIAILGAALMLFAFTFVTNDLQLQSMFSVHRGSAASASKLISAEPSVQLQIMSDRLVNELVNTATDNQLVGPTQLTVESSPSTDIVNGQPIPGSTVSTGFAPRGPMISPRGNP